VDKINIYKKPNNINNRAVTLVTKTGSDNVEKYSLLLKLIVSQMVFYTTQQSITMFSRAYHQNMTQKFDGNIAF
jgi:hypothetical protein